MVAVRIAVLDGSEESTGGLTKWLSSVELGRDADSYGTIVEVASLEDCRRIASSVVRWVGDSSRDFKLGVIGPGADSVLHDLRDTYLEESVLSMLAIAANIEY